MVHSTVPYIIILYFIHIHSFIIHIHSKFYYVQSFADVLWQHVRALHRPAQSRERLAGPVVRHTLEGGRDARSRH